MPVDFALCVTRAWEWFWWRQPGRQRYIALAIAAALSFHLLAYLPPTAAQWTALNLKNAVVVDAVLAVFNRVSAAAP